MSVKVLGIDLAKNVFHIHGVDGNGHVVIEKRLTRRKLEQFLAICPACLIGMEACASAHHWARRCRAFGHEVRLINPRFVQPYVKSNKNDWKDAEAICEAVQRPNMRFVPEKSVEQQDLQALHRIRSRLVHDRTAIVNQIRGLLGEYGIVVAQRVHELRKALPRILEDADNELTPMGRSLFADLAEQLSELDKKIKAYENRINQVFTSSEPCRRVAQVPGIGPLIATALVASVGDASVFRNGRELAAWLGLVPKQRSTGGKNVLLGISKRGDRYLRTLLIHGARATLRYVARKDDRRGAWVRNLQSRRGNNIAAVALANKNARAAWALLVRGGDYRSSIGNAQRQPSDDCVGTPTSKDNRSDRPLQNLPSDMAAEADLGVEELGRGSHLGPGVRLPSNRPNICLQSGPLLSSDVRCLAYSIGCIYVV